MTQIDKNIEIEKMISKINDVFDEINKRHFGDNYESAKIITPFPEMDFPFMYGTYYLLESMKRRKK